MPATQIDRPFRFKTPLLGEGDLLLESFTGTETVSAPFRYVLSLLGDDANLDLEGLLKKPAVITMVLDEGHERHIHGVISRIALADEGTDGRFRYEAEMVPWLWLLTLFSDCRIFQNKTAPDIVEQVFKDRGFSDYRVAYQGSFPTREYCVQYRETDFNFISRLLEEEGIFYFFEHTDDIHTLVLANAQSAVKDCPKQFTVRYSQTTGGVQEDETISRLEQEIRIHTGAVSLTDYDFEKPGTSLLTSLSGNLPGEDYDYPGKYVTKGDGDRYARIRLDSRSLATVTRGLAKVRDSLPRALCWAACWDMVRDAEMRTRDFLTLDLPL